MFARWPLFEIQARRTFGRPLTSLGLPDVLALAIADLDDRERLMGGELWQRLAAPYHVFEQTTADGLAIPSWYYDTDDAPGIEVPAGPVYDR